MDAIAIEGVAAVVSAIVVFCGSVFLLLSLVLGARLAYFLTATITLGFLFMLGLVWSFTPLGPVGKLPEWDQLEAGASAQDINFGPISSYPDSPWRVPDQANEEELTKVSELQTAATDALEGEIQKQPIPGINGISDVTVDTNSVRLMLQGETEYGAVGFTPVQGSDQPVALVVMRYDPGNPLGTSRTITVGTFILFALHLFGLHSSERRARRVTVPPTEEGRPAPVPAEAG